MDRPPHVLFALHPAMGHLLPTLPIVEELVRIGCRVTATITPEHEERVRALGAETVPYTSSLDARLPSYTTQSELAKAVEAIMRDSLSTADVIDGACAETPDVVVHDVTLAIPGRVLSGKWERPNVRLLPIFASNEHFSIDAMIGDLAPPLEPGEPEPVEYKRCGDLISGFVHGHGLSGERAGLALVGHDELSVVLLPQEFQPRGETFGDKFAFVGPTFGEPADDWRPPEGAGPVVLISMGTSTFYSAEFFADCARAFEGSPWHVVIALGGKVAPAELGPLPPNVEVHSWIPIGAVLRHASAYLCQGGISGVMESVFNRTPMVLIPHHPEQIANARRTEEFGVGLVLDEADVTPTLIRETVDRLRATPGLDDHLEALRDLGIRAGGAARAAEVIRARALEHRAARESVTAPM